jgi:hypothetical protein
LYGGVPPEAVTVTLVFSSVHTFSLAAAASAVSIVAGSLISVCCGARPWGEVYDASNCPPTGICSKCKDHATFEQENDDE